MVRKGIQLLLLFASNLFPLYGLFYLGWNPFQTSFVFLVETLFMFLFFEAEMAVRACNGQAQRAILIMIVEAFPAIIMGGAQLLLSTVMFGTLESSLQWDQIRILIGGAFAATIPGMVLVFLKHLEEFVAFIRSGAYKLPLPSRERAKGNSIFIRIFFMQFALIFGGTLGKVFGSLALGVSTLSVIQLFYNLYLFFTSSPRRTPVPSSVPSDRTG